MPAVRRSIRCWLAACSLAFWAVPALAQPRDVRLLPTYFQPPGESVPVDLAPAARRLDSVLSDALLDFGLRPLDGSLAASEPRDEEALVALAHDSWVVAPELALAGSQLRVRLWVVPREAICEVTDADLLRPPLDRSYRVPAGYRINEKLAEARRRAGTTPVSHRARE